MLVSKTTIKIVKNETNGLLSDHIVSKCSFCLKNCRLDSESFKNLHMLSGLGDFFCEFCVRNGFNTKSNKDVIILSFKNIFNYYYTQKHIVEEKIWMSEIEDLVDGHKKVGLNNPIFHYDEKSMLWFINFLRVGDSKRKISLEKVYKTVILMIDSLKIEELEPDIRVDVLKQKYLDAINLFHAKRYRPSNKKILSPKIGENNENKNFY
jgi:hypothetical protein